MFDKIESIKRSDGILTVNFKDGTAKCGTSLELKLYKELEECYSKIETLEERWKNRIGEPKKAVFELQLGTCEIVGCDEDATAICLMDHCYCDSCAEQNKEEEPENWYDNEDEEME
jgi:hypothetical protein